MARRKSFQVSKSSIGQYMVCPRSWLYSRYPGMPKKVDYARLFGIEVHSFIKLLHKKTKTPRPFYFKTLDAAINQWRRRWMIALDKVKANGSLIMPNRGMEFAYLDIGEKCITKYWDANINRPRPIEVEQRYTGRLDGIPLVGIFDQVRRISLKWIAENRPELIVDGQLSPLYDPVVIVDLKTDYTDYDAEKLIKNPTLEEWIRTQYSLHESTQATLYTLLYYQKTGKMPIGFWWYHLRSGMGFFTCHEDESFVTLAGQIRHLVENLQYRSFPKNPGEHCKRCDYLEPCNEDRLFRVSRPGNLEDAVETETAEPTFEKDKGRQLRLKLDLPRKEQVEPVVNRKPRPILVDLPWDDDESIDTLFFHV